MSHPIICMRGGALGDFLLTLPLIEVSRMMGSPIFLYARSTFLKLLNPDWEWLNIYDLDTLSSKFSSLPTGAHVISFWRDSEWQKQAKLAGASRTTSLDPRPLTGEPFAKQASRKLAWQLPSTWIAKAYLGDCWRRGDQTLWVHPGSGGTSKNLPENYYYERAVEWLDSRYDRQVVFSFGEADARLINHFREKKLFKSKRVELIQPSTIQDLKEEMIDRADRFLGNDSGPGHLAANLGIPVEIGFRTTEKSVWRPTGPRVVTYDWVSDSNKIL